MIINNIPLIRKSTILNIQSVCENDMWEDEEFLKKTANQTFWDYPRVRIGQAGLVALSVILPNSIRFMVNEMQAGYITSALVGYGITVVTALGMFGCINLILGSHDWDNYIYKIEAKDRLRKLNRKKKLELKQNKEQSLENEK